MALTYTSSGEVYVLRGVVAAQTGTLSLTVGLYTQSHAVGENTTSADILPVSAGFAGYNPFPTAPGNWQLFSSSSVFATYSYGTGSAVVRWTFTASLGNIHGYYYSEPSGSIVAAEPFSNGPYTILISGDNIRLIPRIEVI